MRDRLGPRNGVVNITPYILIGGDSTRFGRDKATFEFDGEQLAARALRVCEEAFPDAKARFVSKEKGKFFDREMIPDVYPDRGAAGAIHAALADASTPWIFVLACDLPFVTSAFVAKLAAHIGDDNGCVIPIQKDGRWQPLCALYSVDMCLQPFEQAISGDGKHRSLRAIAGLCWPRTVEFAEYADVPDAHRLLTNANSTADLERI